MAKAGKGAVSARIQVVARGMRTDLASRLLAHGFYAGQDQVMLALAAEDGQTPGQLAARMGVRPPTVTKTIARLQAQGFVSKSASGTDARMSHVSLTDAGRQAIEQVEKAVRQSEKAALRGFDKKERKALLKLLKRIEANLSDVPAADADLADDEPDDADDTAADKKAGGSDEASESGA